DGRDEFVRGAEALPYRLVVEVSSRVPTAPGLETTGAELGPAEVRRALAWPRSISLGELDPSKVLGHQAPYLRKVLAAHARGKIANGHAAGLSGRDLEAYAAGRLADRLGALVPGRLADLVLTDSLTPIKPRAVFVGGRQVAAEGRLTLDVPRVRYAAWLRNTVHARRGSQPAHFSLRAPGPTATVRVIQIVPDQIINTFQQATLHVANGEVQPDLAQDVLKIAGVERHGKNGNI